MSSQQLNRANSSSSRREGLRQKPGPFTITIPLFNYSSKPSFDSRTEQPGEEAKQNETYFEESKEEVVPPMNNNNLMMTEEMGTMMVPEDETEYQNNTSNFNEETNGQVQHILAPDEGIYFKFGNPVFPMDADWTVTLSRNDFPWHEIAFPPFTARECFEKYTSVVKDP